MTRRCRTIAALAAAILLVLLTSLDAGAARFGRNKVQYGSFTWNVARTEHFDVYFYDGSEDLADAVSADTVDGRIGTAGSAPTAPQRGVTGGRSRRSTWQR